VRLDACGGAVARRWRVRRRRPLCYTL